MGCVDMDSNQWVWSCWLSQRAWGMWWVGGARRVGSLNWSKWVIYTGGVILCKKVFGNHWSALFVCKYLDCLWAQVQKLKKDRWQERHISRPYLAFDNVLCEALQHNLPPFTPPPHTEDSVYPMPQVIFRMFDYTDNPEVSGVGKGRGGRGRLVWPP